MNLLTCPMCGREASIGTNVVNRQVDDKGTYASMTGYSVNCIWCGVNNRCIAEGYKTPELAAEKWNSRLYVPSEGWKLVPVEPTPEMTAAGYKQYCTVDQRGYSAWRNHLAVYKAMLDAAPSPQCEGGDE